MLSSALTISLKMFYRSPSLCSLLSCFVHDTHLYTPFCSDCYTTLNLMPVPWRSLDRLEMEYGIVVKSRLQEMDEVNLNE